MLASADFKYRFQNSSPKVWPVKYSSFMGVVRLG